MFGKAPHERNEQQEAGGVESHGCGDVPADRPDGRQQHHVRKPEKAEEDEGSQFGCDAAISGSREGTDLKLRIEIR